MIPPLFAPMISFISVTAIYYSPALVLLRHADHPGVGLEFLPFAAVAAVGLGRREVSGLETEGVIRNDEILLRVGISAIFAV